LQVATAIPATATATSKCRPKSRTATTDSRKKIAGEGGYIYIFFWWGGGFESRMGTNLGHMGKLHTHVANCSSRRSTRNETFLLVLLLFRWCCCRAIAVALVAAIVGWK